MRPTPLALALAVILSTPLTAQGPITRANWVSHPAIREIRRITNDIDNHLGQLSDQADSSDCGRGYIAVVAHKYTDAAGIVRKLSFAGGSDDSAGEVTYYYDPKGNLRFSFATTNAVNGTSVEDRRYYSVKGTLLYHDSRLLSGEGYPGSGDDPIWDPAAAFAALCGSDER